MPGEFARYRDLAFDETGYPLVAFTLDENDDRRNDAILLARRDGNGWAYEEVLGSGDTVEAGTNLAMAHHHATGPLLVDHASDHIRFHYQSDDAWQTVDLGVGYRADIAVDDNGMPWVAIQVFDPPALKAAHPVNGSLDEWEVVTVDPTDVLFLTDPIDIDPALTVTDVDSATLESAQVWFGNGFQKGQDRLLFTDQLGITGSYSNNSGVLTLTGTATVAPGATPAPVPSTVTANITQVGVTPPSGMNGRPTM